MNKRAAQVFIASLVFAALVFAMNSVAGAQMGPGWGRSFGMGTGWGHGGGPGWGYDYMASSLNLTDAQRQKAQSIFDSAYRSMQGLRDQMYEKNKVYWNSQKPLTDAQIDKLTAERADLFAKMQATRDKAVSNFYNNVLTPEQRTQYDQLRTSPGQAYGPGWGRGGNGFRRRGPGW